MKLEDGIDEYVLVASYIHVHIEIHTYSACVNAYTHRDTHFVNLHV